MYEILEKNHLAPQVYRYVVRASDIAGKAKPGNFVIIRLDETGERIPITIADFDREKGTLTFFVQAVGKTSIEMSALKTGDFILDVAGPLGNPTEIENFGNVVLVGGGFGIAALYPIAREMTLAGNNTISILGARTQELILLEDEMHKVSKQVFVVTNDGSSGDKGFVTDCLKNLLEQEIQIDRVMAIGPLLMMQAVSELTRPYHIKTVVSLNPIMIDGTGMCGACRVMVSNEMKFACVDGPEFDGHEVDFSGLLQRLKSYLPEEIQSKEKYLNDTQAVCGLDEVIQP